MSREKKLGFSGALAQRFQNSKITPLLALTGLLLGLFAVVVTPREEEPQINVTFANIFVPFPGASPVEVENIVAIPLEQVLAEIEGVKHTYSVSRPGMAVLTIQYEVGEDRTSAIVRLYNAVYSNEDWLPPGSGVMRPLIKPKGIDDVPIVTLTLWTKDEARGAHELQRVAHTLEAEIKRVPGTRDVYTGLYGRWTRQRRTRGAGSTAACRLRLVDRCTALCAAGEQRCVPGWRAGCRQPVCTGYCRYFSRRSD
jgi:multidrug efflux pump subunit AcrB